MADFETLVKQAQLMGLDEEGIADYVKEAREREDRAQERELLKKQADVESEKVQAEAEKVRLDHELEMAKISGIITPTFSDPSVKPSLPAYRDGEDISSYLIRFERIAQLLNLNPDSYAVRLGSLLTGKAVDIYTSLPPEITQDELKKRSFRGFC